MYGQPDKYVVVNDRTGEVTQVSDKADPDWIDDSKQGGITNNGKETI